MGQRNHKPSVKMEEDQATDQPTILGQDGSYATSLSSSSPLCIVYYEKAADYVGTERTGAGGWFLGQREQPERRGRRTSTRTTTTVRLSDGSKDDDVSPHDVLDLHEQVVNGVKCLVVSGNRTTEEEEAASSTTAEQVSSSSSSHIPSPGSVYCELQPSNLKVGDLVYGKFQNNTKNRWYRGRISDVNLTNKTCTILYDDGDGEMNIPYGPSNDVNNNNNVWKVGWHRNGTTTSSSSTTSTTTPSSYNWLDGLHIDLPPKRHNPNVEKFGTIVIQVVDEETQSYIQYNPSSATNSASSSSITTTSTTQLPLLEKRAVQSIVQKVLVDAIKNRTNNHTIPLSVWPTIQGPTSSSSSATIANTAVKKSSSDKIKARNSTKRNIDAENQRSGRSSASTTARTSTSRGSRSPFTSVVTTTSTTTTTTTTTRGAASSSLAPTEVSSSSTRRVSATHRLPPQKSKFNISNNNNSHQTQHPSTSMTHETTHETATAQEEEEEEDFAAATNVKQEHLPSPPLPPRSCRRRAAALSKPSYREVDSDEDDLLNDPNNLIPYNAPTRKRNSPSNKGSPPMKRSSPPVKRSSPNKAVAAAKSNTHKISSPKASSGRMSLPNAAKKIDAVSSSVAHHDDAMVLDDNYSTNSSDDDELLRPVLTRPKSKTQPSTTITTSNHSTTKSAPPVERNRNPTSSKKANDQFKALYSSSDDDKEDKNKNLKKSSSWSDNDDGSSESDEAFDPMPRKRRYILTRPKGSSKKKRATKPTEDGIVSTSLRSRPTDTLTTTEAFEPSATDGRSTRSKGIKRAPTTRGEGGRRGRRAAANNDDRSDQCESNDYGDDSGDEDKQTDAEPVEEACEAYVPNEPCVPTIEVQLMPAAYAEKFYESLTSPSAEWACELGILISDVHGLSPTHECLKSIFTFFCHGPKHGSTYFPDTRMMDLVVNYISHLGKTPGMKHYLAQHVPEKYVEQCLAQLTAPYYIATGDECRVGKDAILRQAQSLHAKMCCADIVLQLLRTEVDACIVNPSLCETLPMLRDILEHRSGPKYALVHAVKATALLWVHHGHFKVGDRCLTDNPKCDTRQRPAEHVVDFARRSACRLFGLLGHLCSYLAWMYSSTERKDAKCVAREISHCFLTQLNQNIFDTSLFVDMDPQEYWKCIKFEFVLSLAKDLVPQMRPLVAKGLGIVGIWNELHDIALYRRPAY